MVDHRHKELYSRYGIAEYIHQGSSSIKIGREECFLLPSPRS
jgi:hypothetical protein